MTGALVALLLAVAVALVLPGSGPHRPSGLRRPSGAARGQPGVVRVVRRVPAGRRSAAARLDERDVALAAELVVAAVDAGIPLPSSVHAVAAQVTGPVGAALDAAARLLAVGAEPSAALAPLLADPASAPVGRGLRAALESGASPVPLLEAAAGSQRERARSARLRRARGLGSRAALPLSLCFLPAFVLVAVVPVVLGGLTTVLSGG